MQPPVGPREHVREDPGGGAADRRHGGPVAGRPPHRRSRRAAGAPRPARAARSRSRPPRPTPGELDTSVELLARPSRAGRAARARARRTTRAIVVAQCSPRPRSSASQRGLRDGVGRGELAVLGADGREPAGGMDHRQVVVRGSCRRQRRSRARRPPRRAGRSRTARSPGPGSHRPPGRLAALDRAATGLHGALDVAVHVAVDLLQARHAGLEHGRVDASALARPRSSAATSSSRPVFTAIQALVKHRPDSDRDHLSPSASSQPATVSILPRWRYAYQCR